MTIEVEAIAVKVLVCGGSRFSNLKLLDRALDAVHRKKHIHTLITGTLSGAEEMAYYWAVRTRIETILTVPMKPDLIGKMDYRRRNTDMLERLVPEAVVAFPGGAETNHMATLAERIQIPVWRVLLDWR